MVRPRAIVFDIGGVLEITPRLGVLQRWEARLGLPAGEVRSRLVSLFRAGEIGAVTEEAVHAGVGAALGLDEGKVNAFMDDIWTEYLGTPNVELIRYFRSLRPRYRTALLSNSFVGARRKEQERYGFEEMADLIVYSHEVGMSKPDRRIYELTCDRLAVRPDEAIFLDDVAECVDAAREVGMRAILLRDNAQAIADIEALIATIEPPSTAGSGYRPTISAAYAERLRHWHESAYRMARTAQTFDYLGLTLEVPPEVMPITPVSDLLGTAVLAEVRADDRVLDMGTGSGVNAILAASKATEVVGVDINPRAVEAARRNAVRNGVADRIEVRGSDVFSAVDGEFDRNARRYLRANGRMLVFFGTSGDLGYLRRLLAEEGFHAEVVAHRDLVKDGMRVDYYTYRVTRAKAGLPL